MSYPGTLLFFSSLTASKILFAVIWLFKTKHIYMHHWDWLRNHLYHGHPLIDLFQINKHCFYINFSFTFVIRTIKVFPVFIVSFLFFAKGSHLLWFSGDLDLLWLRLANGISSRLSALCVKQWLIYSDYWWFLVFLYHFKSHLLWIKTSYTVYQKWYLYGSSVKHL